MNMHSNAIAPALLWWGLGQHQQDSEFLQLCFLYLGAPETDIRLCTKAKGTADIQHEDSQQSNAYVAYL